MIKEGLRKTAGFEVFSVPASPSGATHNFRCRGRRSLSRQHHRPNALSAARAQSRPSKRQNDSVKVPNRVDAASARRIKNCRPCKSRLVRPAVLSKQAVNILRACGRTRLDPYSHSRRRSERWTCRHGADGQEGVSRSWPVVRAVKSLVSPGRYPAFVRGLQTPLSCYA